MDEDSLPHPGYRRHLVSPSSVSIDGHLVDHANRLGIKLKSSAIIRQSTAPPGSRGHRASQQASTNRSVRTANSGMRSYPNSYLHGPTYIQNVVVPLSVSNEGERGSLSQKGSKSRRHGGKAQQPQQTTATSVRTLSAYIDRYNSTNVTDKGRKDEPEEPVSGRSWNKSEQARRFHSEQEMVSKSRQMKRTSQIQSHRIDRMYYMSGTPLTLDQRYTVNNDELERLKDLTSVRKRGKYYGKGISKTKCKCKHVGQNTQALLAIFSKLSPEEQTLVRKIVYHDDRPLGCAVCYEEERLLSQSLDAMAMAEPLSEVLEGGSESAKSQKADDKSVDEVKDEGKADEKKKLKKTDSACDVKTSNGDDKMASETAKGSEKASKVHLEDLMPEVSQKTEEFLKKKFLESLQMFSTPANCKPKSIETANAEPEVSFKTIFKHFEKNNYREGYMLLDPLQQQLFWIRREVRYVPASQFCAAVGSMKQPINSHCLQRFAENWFNPVGCEHQQKGECSKFMMGKEITGKKLLPV